MKFDQSLRNKFKEQHGSFVFERETIKEFLRPYFTAELDPEKLVEQKENIFTQQFIQGYRDVNGVRDVIAFNSAGEEDEPEQISYAFITTETPYQVLERQERRISKQILGLNRTLQKITMQKETLKNQVTIAVSETGELTVEHPVAK